MPSSQSCTAFVALSFGLALSVVPCRGQTVGVARAGVSALRREGAVASPGAAARADTAPKRLRVTAGDRVMARVLLSAVGAAAGFAGGLQVRPSDSWYGGRGDDSGIDRRRLNAALLFGGIGAALGAALPGFPEDDRCAGFGHRLRRAFVGAAGGTVIGFAMSYVRSSGHPGSDIFFGLDIPFAEVGGASAMTIRCEAALR